MADAKSKSNLYSVLYKYRLFFFIGVFLVAAVTTVALVYAHPKSVASKITFDSYITDNSEYVKGFVKKEKLKDIQLSINWNLYKAPTESDSGLTGGQYKFIVSFVSKSTPSIASISVTPLLQVPWAQRVVNETTEKKEWKTTRSVGSLTNVLASTATDTKNANLLITFNYSEPFKSIWPISVNEPVLYLKITYEIPSKNTLPAKQVTVYVKQSLRNMTPYNVQ